METVTESPQPRRLRVIRLPEVMERTGLKRATIYKRGKEGSFPRPIDLGGNVTAWSEEEVDSWLAARIAERDAQAGAA